MPFWFDKVDDWLPLYQDDERPERERPSRAENSAPAKHRTGDGWQGVVRGWADSALDHQAALRGLNARHREFWRRKS